MVMPVDGLLLAALVAPCGAARRLRRLRVCRHAPRASDRTADPRITNSSFYFFQAPDSKRFFGPQLSNKFLSFARFGRICRSLQAKY